MKKIGLRANNRGMVLLTVIMVVIVLSIFLTSILSQNMSQSSMLQGQVDRVKAETLAKGAFWKAYGQMNAGVATPTVVSETLDDRTYTVTVGSRPASSTAAYTVEVSYP